VDGNSSASVAESATAAAFAKALIAEEADENFLSCCAPKLAIRLFSRSTGACFAAMVDDVLSSIERSMVLVNTSM
jgi:hypothetical protein